MIGILELEHPGPRTATGTFSVAMHTIAQHFLQIREGLDLENILNLLQLIPVCNVAEYQLLFRPLFGDFMFFISLPRLFLIPAFFTIINNFLAKFKF